MSLIVYATNDNEKGIAFLSCAFLAKEDPFTFFINETFYHLQGYVHGDYIESIHEYHKTGLIDSVAFPKIRQFLIANEEVKIHTGAELRDTYEYYGKRVHVAANDVDVDQARDIAFQVDVERGKLQDELLNVITQSVKPGLFKSCPDQCMMRITVWDKNNKQIFHNVNENFRLG